LTIRLLGVSYDLTQVGRILKKVGWNGPPLRPAEACQKGPPPGRRPAKPAECSAMAGGDGAGFKKADDEIRVILYVYESGFYLLPHVSRTAAADRLGTEGADSCHQT